MLSEQDQEAFRKLGASKVAVRWQKVDSQQLIVGWARARGLRAGHCSSEHDQDTLLRFRNRQRHNRLCHSYPLSKNQIAATVSCSQTKALHIVTCRL